MGRPVSPSLHGGQAARPVKQEVTLASFCTCRVCGREWFVHKELVWQWDVECHWNVGIRQVPWQRLFCDEGGAWIRRKESA